MFVLRTKGIDNGSSASDVIPSIDTHWEIRVGVMKQLEE